MAQERGRGGVWHRRGGGEGCGTGEGEGRGVAQKKGREEGGKEESSVKLRKGREQLVVQEKMLTCI